MQKLHLTACHQKPERSFFYKGKQFPVCARCTGIHLGYLAMPLFLFGFVSLSWPLTLLFILPTTIDGFTQAYGKRESNNPVRFITGLLAGVGLMSFSSKVGWLIVDLIHLTIK